MELVHVVRWVDTVSCTERAEHLGRQFQIDHVNHLVAAESELAPRYSHYNCIPLAVVFVPEHHRLKILIKRIVRRCAVCIEAAFKEFLFCHRQFFRFLFLFFNFCANLSNNKVGILFAFRYDVFLGAICNAVYLVEVSHN